MALGFNNKHKFTRRKGFPVKGYLDPEYSRTLLKVSVAWERRTLDAINRRVVRRNSTFAHEARRIMEIGLQLDHMNDEKAAA